MSRYAFPGKKEDIDLARDLEVGDRVRFRGEKQARFKVKARGDRYIILTKPFNARKTVLYTIIDLKKGIRGVDNLVFSIGYETSKSIHESMRLLDEDKMEISHRNNATLNIVDVKKAKK